MSTRWETEPGSGDVEHRDLQRAAAARAILESERRLAVALAAYLLIPLQCALMRLLLRPRGVTGRFGGIGVAGIVKKGHDVVF